MRLAARHRAVEYALGESGLVTIFTAYNMRSRGGAGLLWQRLVNTAARRAVVVRYAAPLSVSDVPAARHTRCPCLPGAVGNLLYMVCLLLHGVFSWRVARGDVVISQGILYTLPMLPLKWKGARLVTLVHGDYLEELERRSVPRLLRFVLRRLYEPMYRASDLLLPISADLAQRLTKRHGVPVNKIRRVCNSAPIIARSAPDKLNQLRHELGIREDAFVLVYAGGLNPIKRVDRFVALIAALSRDRNVRGIVVGDGPQRGALETMTRELGISERVVFTGWRSPAIPYIELADLVVMCSDYEGCPTVLLEGLSLGRAMVGSRVGGIPEILADNRLTFYPLTVEALEATVRGIIRPDGQIESWVEEHLRQQCKRFSIPWEVQVIEAVTAGSDETTDGAVKPRRAGQ